MEDLRQGSLGPNEQIMDAEKLKLDPSVLLLKQAPLSPGLGFCEMACKEDGEKVRNRNCRIEKDNTLTHSPKPLGSCQRHSLRFQQRSSGSAA